MKKISLFLFAFFCFALFSCKTTLEIPEDATSTQLIQLGQDALELNNFSQAEKYYMAVIRRYGNDNSIYIEASYELGHLYLKQKKYSQAYNKYSEIVDLYKNAEYGTLPASYKKLALIGLDRIPEKYKNAE